MMAKYDELCKLNRFGFLPIVFESNGFLHAAQMVGIKVFQMEFAILVPFMDIIKGMFWHLGYMFLLINLCLKRLMRLFLQRFLKK